MKRYDFFSTLGITAGMIFMAPVVSSCSKDSASDPDTGGNNNNSNNGSIDFTIDLSTSTYAALNSNGGSVVKSGIIIARTSSGNFVALASACTHAGTTISFESNANRFHCSNHSSNFSLDGSVLNGPATSALKKYNTQLTGTNLRIFA
jgi:cytochrome b6-f complex iron-sulfur subunit